MSECPECGMRDDDWFLCRREPCAVKTTTTSADRIEALEAERDKQREHIRAQAEDIMKLGHLVYDDADPPATWKMRALTAEADKARLSENIHEAWREADAIWELTTDKRIIERLDRIRAALSGSGSGWRVPDGWKLVPVELTQSMIIAYNEEFEKLSIEKWANALLTWPALLAASPAAPQQGGAPTAKTWGEWERAQQEAERGE